MYLLVKKRDLIQEFHEVNAFKKIDEFERPDTDGKNYTLRCKETIGRVNCTHTILH